MIHVGYVKQHQQ